MNVPHAGASTPWPAELARKGLHLSSLVLPVGVWWVGAQTALFVLVPLTLLAMTLDVLRFRSKALGRFIDTAVGWMMRETERRPPEQTLTFNGATWVLISLTSLVLVLPLAIAVLAFSAFMVSDAAAALVGRYLGRHPWPGTTRTVEGTLAFVGTGAGLVLIASNAPLWCALLSVALSGLAEAFTNRLNDNLIGPWVLAMGLLACEHWLMPIALVLLV